MTATSTTASKVSFFSKLWAGMVAAEHAVKSAVQKAVGAVPEVEAIAQQYEPLAAGILNEINAGSGKYASTAANAVATIGTLIDDGGAAVEADLTNLGFDATLISDIKSLFGNLKAGATQNAAA